MSKVSHIPSGYHAITPYLIVNGAARAIEFYQKALGAKQIERVDGPNGKIMHAELEIGDSRIMLADEVPEMGYRSATSIGGSPISLYVYLPDCDSVVKQAVAEGAELKRPLETQFYGDRNGTIHDPFGHIWTIATHVEDVSREEMERRMKAEMERRKKAHQAA